MSEESFQERVQPWLMECFGAMIAGDREERNHRFLEEALELVQACGATASEARQLVDYVYGRPVGEPAQEVGGVMVTLAALCLANDLDMHQAGEVELARIWTKVEQIRAKQAAKPKHSPLPAIAPVAAPAKSKSPMLDEFLNLAKEAGVTHLRLPEYAAPVATQEMVDALNWSIAFLYQHAEIGRAEWLREAVKLLTAAPTAAQEPAGTLHDDGYFTWKGRSPYESNFAGWRRDFYLAPVASQPAQDEPDGPCDNCGLGHQSSNCIYKPAPAPAEPAAPAGWKLVPTEATDEMRQAAWDVSNALYDTPEGDDPLPRHQYRAMLDAAPTPPETWKVLPSQAGAPPLDDEMRDILGRPCFTLIVMAQLLRGMGHDIKTRAEDEQAASIHWMLDLYMKHGSEWRTEAARIIQEFKDGLGKPTGEPLQEAKE